MPNRLLREGVTTSDRINGLSPEEEVFFYRLLVVCDDFGRMDARPAILKAQCFPLRDNVNAQKIESWLSSLAEKKLIVRYQTKDGAPLLAVDKWDQRVRSRPKYAGPEDDGCQTLVGQLSDRSQASDGLGKGKGKGKGAAKRPLPDDWVPASAVVERLSREFGLRVPEDVNRYVAAFRDACRAKGYEYADFDAAFANCVRQDWPKFRGRSGAVVPLPSERRLVV